MSLWLSSMPCSAISLLHAQPSFSFPFSHRAPPPFPPSLPSFLPPSFFYLLLSPAQAVIKFMEAVILTGSIPSRNFSSSARVNDSFTVADLLGPFFDPEVAFPLPSSLPPSLPFCLPPLLPPFLAAVLW